MKCVSKKRTFYLFILRREHFSSDLNKVKECIIEKELTGWGGGVGG